MLCVGNVGNRNVGIVLSHWMDERWEINGKCPMLKWEHFASLLSLPFNVIEYSLNQKNKGTSNNKMNWENRREGENVRQL